MHLYWHWPPWTEPAPTERELRRLAVDARLDRALTELNGARVKTPESLVRTAEQQALDALGSKARS
jgi:hypothetical protein